MRLDVLDAVFAIARLSAETLIPVWANGGEFLSITRTRDELSIVCEAHRVPASIECRSGWRCLKVAGPLDFSMVGVLASLAEPLAQAGVPIFVVSTFDTDYLLVAATDLDRAIAALESSGRSVHVP